MPWYHRQSLRNIQIGNDHFIATMREDQSDYH